MRGERLRFWLGKRLLRRADAVIAVSQATAADAARFAGVDPRRARVVPEAASEAFSPRPGAPERVMQRWGVEAGYMLFVGALDARKDPGSLLRAWSAARAVRPELTLVVAGEPGPQAPPSMPGARLLGRVSDEDLADLYTSAGCFVFPSRYEGFGLPCLEAMSCGCPVAAFRNSSVPEVVGEAGMIVDDGDAEALGRAAAGMPSPSPGGAPASSGRRPSAGARRRSRRSRCTSRCLTRTRDPLNQLGCDSVGAG